VSVLLCCDSNLELVDWDLLNRIHSVRSWQTGLHRVSTGRLARYKTDFLCRNGRVSSGWNSSSLSLTDVSYCMTMHPVLTRLTLTPCPVLTFTNDTVLIHRAEPAICWGLASCTSPT
jgi:hypothetical protein